MVFTIEFSNGVTTLYLFIKQFEYPTNPNVFVNVMVSFMKIPVFKYITFMMHRFDEVQVVDDDFECLI